MRSTPGARILFPMFATAERRERRLRALVQDHQAAIAEFVDRANALPEARWLVPRADGKWTPAQEARHLILTYEAFTADLTGVRRAEIRASLWWRLLNRAVGLTSILWRRRIPVAVRAPREVRPAWDETPREPLLAELRDRAARFDAAFVEAWHSRPRWKVRHPRFGGLSLDHAIRLSSVHTRHHAAFLPGPQS